MNNINITQILKDNGIEHVNEFGPLEYLKLIPLLYQQNTELNQRLQHLEETLIPKWDLTKRADVKKYLEISESTLSLMMRDGRLKQGIHFTKELKGRKPKITFVESAIVKLKEMK